MDNDGVPVAVATWCRLRQDVTADVVEKAVANTLVLAERPDQSKLLPHRRNMVNTNKHFIVVAIGRVRVGERAVSEAS